MAYAAVDSLHHTLKRHIDRRDRDGIGYVNKPQMYELSLKLSYLTVVLQGLDAEDKRGVDRRVMNELDAKITEAAWKLEDVLDSYMLNHSLPRGDETSLVDESVVEQEVDLFLKRAKELGDEYFRELHKPLPAAGDEEDDVACMPMDDFAQERPTTIGLWDQFEEIRNELLDLQPGTKVVSLVGMAGIGKSHLARQIYQHPTICEHFDLMVWVRLGAKHQWENIFVDILAQIEGKPRNAYSSVSAYELGKVLHGRRWLIILDDLWSLGVYSYFKFAIAEDGNSRRILVTTRLEGVVKSYSTTIHKIRFLDDTESWDLLWRNVFFGEESFPPQLEKAGRKIAEMCEGLPLLILTVADILRELDNKTEEYWMKVAHKKTSTFPDAYEKIYKVLKISYDYMPQHLKACFLYMGVFPQSSEIPMTKLINLWIVEDFVVSMLSKWFQYMEELVSSSVVIVCRHAQSSKLRIKSCKLHSVYWYLCVKEARKNKFFHVLKKLSDASEEHMESQHRLSIQNNILFGIKEAYASMAATLTARSLLCTGEDHEYPVPICLNLALLRVLDALAIRFYEFPEEVVKLVRLRYLALTHNGEVPSSISNLKQVECLILRPHHHIRSPKVSTCLPMDIWDMDHLRYLWIMGSNLPDPSSYYRVRLETLYVNDHSCTEAVFGIIFIWLRKLVIDIELQPDGAESSSCFKYIRIVNNLESLKCVVLNPWLRSQVVASPNHLSNLPRNLKKLSLNGLGYSWEYMTAIGSLPSLQVLELRYLAFRGAEWKTGAGEFSSLEFLVLEDLNLMYWIVDNETCFPRLEQLVIGHCYKLKEIPRQIGALPKMKRIEIVDCSPSAVASAEEKRRSSLKVEIDSSWSRSR